MDENMKDKIGGLYFGVFGIVVFLVGILEIGLGVLNKTVHFGPLIFSGYFMLWRGAILFFAGIFYLLSVKKFSDVHQKAKAMVASIMIWIIAGTQIFSIILDSIIGDGSRWFNTWEGFLSSYAPPYIPSIILLPFTLVVAYYVLSNKDTDEKNEMIE
ncbi:MAG: hypothetical protein KGY66_00705 [Candidatus Thermoplasmatota archaeon]|nr:hypothetical protein [Candidatus Thermoplasmatota archaeon]MBS3789424.1 hypothetical protein [Candidatus Thermoplasmatota archaeon]